MPGPPLDAVETDRDLPKKADVVIVGGGIIGVSAALVLAERGIDVVLCEKGVLAGEQSSRNWGWVRVMGRDPREIPLMLETQRIWDGLDDRAGGTTGFARKGILYIAETDKDLSDHAAWLDVARPMGVDSRRVGPQETQALMTGCNRLYKGALYTPSDGRAEPQKAVPAIAAGARRAGARLVTGCAARGVEFSGGRLSAVVTEKGRIATSSVIVAGGAWSRLFLKGLGIRLPQLKVRNTVMRTSPVPGGPDGAGATHTYCYRKRLDGGYTIAHDADNVHPLVPDSFAFFKDFGPARKTNSAGVGLSAQSLREWFELSAPRLDRPGPFERHRILDPRPDPRKVTEALREMAQVFPALKSAVPQQIWAGLIDVTPDAVPVISTVDSVPGLTIATGFSGHGFGIGPGAGQLAADLTTGHAPLVDPTDFRFSRFSDGSPITLYGHI